MRRRSTVLFALLLVGGMAALVAGDARIFPGPPTDTDPRANTPNDPDFDKAEPDDPDTAVACGAAAQPQFQVRPDEGPHGDPTKLDAEDVLVHFSDGVDDDGNGFVDDIAGWDFFDDDNDPFDASSYSSANNHGSGRASDAVAEGNNRLSGIGLCPQCRLVPIRVWDTFVVDNNNFALCLLYAADNGIEVTEAALGALTTTAFAQAATQYAYEHGVAEMDVSSDLNTADHNSPANFNNTIFVKGTVADAEGASTDVNRPPFPQVALSAPIGTWFRDSNLTQYGGHAHIDMKGVTGSECTGQAAGAAGLLMSYGKQRGTPLTANEVKQILTLTAEDVLPGDTLGTGDPDPSQPRWDQHFGYGRF